MHLCNQAVAKRSVGLRRYVGRHAGGIRSDYADISNDNAREIRAHRKSKVSYAMVISVGLAGT